MVAASPIGTTGMGDNAPRLETMPEHRMSLEIPPPSPAATGERGRRGGRAGKRAGHAAAGIEQPPFCQRVMPLQPTALVSDDELESIHLASLRVLKEIGLDVLHDEARALMKKAGADHGADGALSA
jgi:trimethylamine--corrinoid protein Co-methyltransferase